MPHTLACYYLDLQTYRFYIHVPVVVLAAPPTILYRFRLFSSQFLCVLVVGNTVGSCSSAIFENIASWVSPGGAFGYTQRPFFNKRSNQETVCCKVRGRYSRSKFRWSDDLCNVIFVLFVHLGRQSKCLQTTFRCTNAFYLCAMLTAVL